jgi:hypothetical protein
LKRITISYTEDEEKWINKHPEINISGLFRKLIEFLDERDVNILNHDDANKILESTKKTTSES